MANRGGIRFSESLSGYLAQGDDFWEAYRLALERGQAARFWVTVTILDLDAFLDDPEHIAPMSGRVALAGLGAGRVKDGRIHLFCKREGQTRLLYHLPFTLRGEPYVLRGEKRLRRAGGAEAWRQMTTLYTELAPGNGEEGGAPVRRGIMRIGPGQVALQALSFRPVAAGDPITAARNIARFLRFSSSSRR